MSFICPVADHHFAMLVYVLVCTFLFDGDN